MVAIYYFLEFILLVCPAFALKLPSYMKPCNRNDPKLNECIVKNGREAIPHFIHGDSKYGVPDFDPFNMGEMKVRQGTQQVGLNLTLTKPKLYGLSKIDFYKASVDWKKNHEKWHFRIKSLKLIGPYKATGKVLLLPVTGEGIANITVTDAVLTYSFDFNFIKKKGKDYINIVKSNFTYDVGRLYFNLTNLFNGDKLLGDNMNHFLNENWKEMFNAIAPEMVTTFNMVFRNLLDNVAGLVPFDELYLNSKP